jgi:RNA polymerase sigma-70 factor (ECF subfamily)
MPVCAATLVDWRRPADGARAVPVTAADPGPAPPAEGEHGLIRQAQDGDRTACAALAERYWGRLFRWLYRLARDRHAAEDLAQDTFLKAFAHLHQFRPGSNFAAWLFRIGHNLFANHCRARPRRDPLPEELPDPGDGPEAAALSREALHDLGRALDRLPAPFRAALLLRAEEGLSFREIAEVLGLTEETARWRVFKARQKLLDLLSPRPEPDAP